MNIRNCTNHLFYFIFTGRYTLSEPHLYYTVCNNNHHHHLSHLCVLVSRSTSQSSTTRTLTPVPCMLRGLAGVQLRRKIQARKFQVSPRHCYHVCSVQSIYSALMTNRIAECLLATARYTNLCDSCWIRSNPP